MGPSNRNIRSRFHDGIWNTDLASLSPGRASVLKVLRVIHVALGELSGEYLTSRARGLVYATLLSVVPLLAVTFSILKGLGIHARYEVVLYYLLEPLGDRGIDLSMQIIGFVENARAGVLGTVGLAFLLYGVAAQLRRLEDALNAAWNVRTTAPFVRRIVRYLSATVLAPIGLAVAGGFAASFAHASFFQGLFRSETLAWLLPLFGRLFFAAAACGIFAFVYLVFPNTKVHPTAAISGGLFAGSAWLLTGWVFARFIATSARYSVIYSGFAALILSLIWLYWSFLILLVGARVAFYVQYPGRHLVPVERIPLSPSRGERIGLAVMFLLGQNFHDGHAPWTLAGLSRRLRVPSEAINEVLDFLERGGLVETTGERHPGGFLPAKDLEVMTVQEILDVIRSGDEKSVALKRGDNVPEAVETLISGVDHVVREYLGVMSLADLLRAEPPGTETSTSDHS